MIGTVKEMMLMAMVMATMAPTIIIKTMMNIYGRNWKTMIIQAEFKTSAFSGLLD
jgi:hypothetical protein